MCSLALSGTKSSTSSSGSLDELVVDVKKLNTAGSTQCSSLLRQSYRTKVEGTCQSHLLLLPNCCAYSETDKL